MLGYFGAELQNHSWLEKVLRGSGQPAFWVRAGEGPGLEIVSDGEIYRSDRGGVGTLVGSALGKTSLLKSFAMAGVDALKSDEADGQYALVWYEPQAGLTLAHDPFGATRLFYARLGQTLWFSNAFKLLLGLPPFQTKRELNLTALHTYLSFSFVAAPHTLIQGIEVVPPNVALTFNAPLSSPVAHRLFAPESPAANPDLSRSESWQDRLQTELGGAVQRRLGHTNEVAVHLSGGLDSSAVAAWLLKSGVKTSLFHLDFGAPHNPERIYAAQTAAWLKLPLVNVAVEPKKQDAARLLEQLVSEMGEPWGDPVTLPLYLGCQAVQQAGLGNLFNGEGGDQLFAGWPNRSMLTAELYSGGDSTHEAEARVQSYLRTFHHFYGLEEALYTSALQQVSRSVALSDYVQPYLMESALPDLFDCLRWANFWLKGSQNIMPRAAALSRGAGLTMSAPLFDRQLARFALQIPRQWLMHGTEEKYLLKQGLAQSGLLPPEILARPKRGMGVPVTYWCLGPLHSEFKHLLKRLAKRGYFHKEYLQMLLKGQDLPGELRQQRRLGEKIWQLGLLEIWLQLFYDNKV